MLPGSPDNEFGWLDGLNDQPNTPQSDERKEAEVLLKNDSWTVLKVPRT